MADLSWFGEDFVRIPVIVQGFGEVQVNTPIQVDEMMLALPTFVDGCCYEGWLVDEREGEA